MNRQYQLLIAFLFIWCFQASGQENGSDISESDYSVIKDLRQEWLTVDKDNRYVPYISEQQEKGPVIGVQLDLARYSGNKLRYCVPKNSSLLINQQLVQNFNRSVCLFLDIDSST